MTKKYSKNFSREGSVTKTIHPPPEIYYLENTGFWIKTKNPVSRKVPLGWNLNKYIISMKTHIKLHQ
jgi:hypothetical protein